ncbi:hypothetical protein KQI22_13025 [Kineothrix sp. MSJ-39]|uniref:hypothetical protein n=1 Tax=Kineothrix sp. MSJ-39 TaxID=2841533 RepID=UPI001C10B8DC|nr:hypothetical protein [Kineothrix sp. MSJ-39]MBU5430972.1 hypothetical protein [Kineothrix sp. MSJ-39]
MQSKKQRVEIIFIDLGEETNVTEQKNEAVSGNAVEKENDACSYVSTAEKEYGSLSVREDNKYEVAEQVNHFLNEYKIARNHKDLLLHAIFKEKEDFMSLYNALNGTSYTDAAKLEITTLENAVYMSVQNDISFVFLSELYMIEHQSTINPNMPLRNLTYIAKVLSKITAKEDIYGSKQIKLPTPRFVVLYNGTRQMKERTVLRLSDAYEKKLEEPELELITTVLNINEGYNEQLKNACKLLSDYMTLITKIRENQNVMDLQQATYQAIEECIREDILKDFLMRHRAEVIAMMLYDFDMEKHIESEKAYEYERGIEKGMEKGIKLLIGNLMDSMHISEQEARKYLKLQ